MPYVLSIQSQVIHGHVGNAAATLPLQAQGFDVWAVPVAVLAHHPGHGDPAPAFMSPAQLQGWLAALDRLPEKNALRGILSGWLGRVETAETVRAAVRRIRQTMPNMPYLCDPVMGDHHGTHGGGLYVPEALAQWIGQHLLPEADIATPNQFELEYLTGHSIRTLTDAMQASLALRQRLRPDGPAIVALTSFRRSDREPEYGAEALVTDAEGCWLAQLPDLGDAVPKGSGDLFAALFLARLLRGKPPRKALAFACAGCFAMLAEALLSGAREMPFAAGLDLLRNPPRAPRLQRLR